jgi:hypothetical protein
MLLRYTTSAFLRHQHARVLTRTVAPHIFETPSEARAFHEREGGSDDARAFEKDPRGGGRGSHSGLPRWEPDAGPADYRPSGIFSPIDSSPCGARYTG